MALVRTCLLSLFLFAPVAVNGFRAKTGRLDTASDESGKWCNPFSSGKTKYYRFDVRTAGDDCKTGTCMALMLIRNASDPQLEINYGSSWVVKMKSGTDDQLDWKLVQQNPGVPTKHDSLKLHDVHEIIFKEGNNNGLADIIDIKWGDGEELQLTGGLFYDEALVLRGLRKMIDENSTDFIPTKEQDASTVDERGRDGLSDQGVVGNGGKWGHRVGAGVGAVGVGGAATAAAAAGVGLANTAIVGGAMAGLLGGAVAGGVIGLGIGALVGLAGAAGMFELVHDHGLSATEKVWAKLYCLNGFQTCYKNEVIDTQRTTLLMPRDNQCKELRFYDTCKIVDGATRRDSLPFPECKCPDDKDEVYCKGKKKAARKFHISSVEEYETCACNWGGPKCEEIDGATARDTQLYPSCKCKDDSHKVKCGTEVVAERKFNAADVYAANSTCNPVCG